MNILNSCIHASFWFPPRICQPQLCIFTQLHITYKTPCALIPLSHFRKCMVFFISFTYVLIEISWFIVVNIVLYMFKYRKFVENVAFLVRPNHFFPHICGMHIQSIDTIGQLCYFSYLIITIMHWKYHEYYFFRPDLILHTIFSY